MHRSTYTVGVVIPVLILAAFALSCGDQRDGIMEKSLLQPSSGPATVILTAAWDTWWQNVSGKDNPNCNSPGSFAKFPDCERLTLARSNSFVARTYLAIDFDTENIPDNATIESLKLKLYFKDGEFEQTEDPGDLMCADLYMGPGSGTDEIGFYFGGYDAAHAPGWQGDEPGGVLTDICGSDTTDCAAGTAFCYMIHDTMNQVHLVPDSFVELIPEGDPDKFVNLTGKSRYGIDLELALPGVFKKYVFTSMEGANSKSLPPTLEVVYSVPGGGGGRGEEFD